MSDLTEVSRKLVAVFAADVEGYSRLMGTDEVGTLNGLTERRAILDRFIGEHRGRIANTAGDSVLAEFGSAVDAVKCAVEAQTALAEANSNVPADRRINFRIGVHIGDVMVRAGDLFGDGVNIAARLQAIAKPGSVCISGTTHDQVRKLFPITFRDLGVQQVKNIEEPIRAYEADGLNDASGFKAKAPEKPTPLPLPDKPSIAVLPFQNMSGDPEQEYFADGVEEITTALSRFSSLFVIARNSAFAYKGRAIDLKQVGRELGVRYLLEGSVRKAGGQIRVTGQLIEATTGAHLWADKFEGSLEEIFEVQDRVTSSVVGVIAPKIERAEIDRATRKPTENLEAYDWYLRAIAAYERWTGEASQEAIRLFKKAIEVDPEFVAAMAWIGGCHLMRAVEGWMVDRDREIAEAIEYIRYVQQRRTNDAFVLASTALALAVFTPELQIANSSADRALSLNPNETLSWQASGWIKLWLGYPEKAIDHLLRVVRLNPFDRWNVNAMNGLAWAHLFIGDLKGAQVWVQNALAVNANVIQTLRASAAVNAALGEIQGAREAANRILQLNPHEKISTILIFHLARRPEDRAKIVEYLRLAGLPE